MWREFFKTFGMPCFFGEPVSAEAVSDLEQSLSVVLPPDLRELFFEMNGIAIRPNFFDDIEEKGAVLQVVWTLDEVRQENQALRSRDDGSEPVFAGLPQFLFFACEPNGDFVGYTICQGYIANPELFVVSHEDYTNRRVQCASLQQYLTILMETSQ